MMDKEKLLDEKIQRLKREEEEREERQKVLCKFIELLLLSVVMFFQRLREEEERILAELGYGGETEKPSSDVEIEKTDVQKEKESEPLSVRVAHMVCILRFK